MNLRARSLCAVALAAAVSAGLAAWHAEPARGQATATVTVGDDFFDLKSITVAVGTTVVWSTSGRNGHTVTSDSGLFDSGVDPFLREGDTFEFTFSEAGAYPYYCRFHGGPGGVGMAGTVVAAAEAAETPQTPSVAAPEEREADGGPNGAIIAIAVGGAVALAAAAAGALALRRR